MGTIVAENNSENRAIIIDKKINKQNIFKLGDLLQGGTIKKILRGKVVLDVNGNAEALLLKDREGGGESLALRNAITQKLKPVINSATSEREIKRRPLVIRPRRRVPIDNNKNEDDGIPNIEKPQLEFDQDTRFDEINSQNIQDDLNIELSVEKSVE